MMENIYEIDLTEMANGVRASMAHTNSPHAPPDAEENIPITKPDVESVLTGVISSHSHVGSTVILAWSPDIYLDHPPEGFAPCIPDDKTDNSVAFMKLADEATKRHCHLVLPYGKTQVNKFDLTGRKGVVLKGSGAKVCILKQTPKQEMDFVTLTGADWISDSCGLQDVGLEGNYQVGIFSLLRIAAVNGMCKFRDLYLYNGGHGITFESKPYCWVYNTRDVWINQMRGCGVNGVGTDNSMQTIDISGTQDHCLRAAGANCRLINFKIMGSKKASGVYLSGSRLQLLGIDSQESFMHGMHVKNALDCTITNYNADNNGYNWLSDTTPKSIKVVPDAYGLFIESGENNTYSDYNFSNRNSSYKYGVGAYHIAYSAIKQKIKLNDERNPYGTSMNLSLTSTIERN
jgi:hypothetical protein